MKKNLMTNKILIMFNTRKASTSKVRMLNLGEIFQKRNLILIL